MKLQGVKWLKSQEEKKSIKNMHENGEWKFKSVKRMKIKKGWIHTDPLKLVSYFHLDTYTKTCTY